MPTAEARIGTARAGRYLAQLCQHATSTSAGRPAAVRRRRRHAPGGASHPAGMPPRADWTETHGTISFPGGTITLQATADALIVRADTGTEPELRRVQELVGGHLTRFGRRDQLTVAWNRLDPPA
jgi:hypothetical protein